MPYTPPSHSPAASPVASRRSSYSSSSGALPRSASYLKKHRRSPSAPVPVLTSTEPSTAVQDLSSCTSSSPSSTQTAKDSSGSSSSSSTSISSSVNDQSSTSSSIMATATMTMSPAPLLGPITLTIPSSVRQSPPPVSSRSMPVGAVLSPPESASDSDEDGLVIRGRDRQSLKDLKSSIRPTTMEVSPHIIAANPSPTKSESPSFVLSHRRSNSESGDSTPRSSDNAIDPVDDETDTEIYKPKMVRKKSGELVRPALRASSRSRRANSAPGTPVAFKAVHFDSQLEHVRHFAHQDRPAAVSAGTSPNEAYESENEFPFYDSKPAVEPPFSWEMITSNFPALSPYRKAQPICLEKVWLSPDQKMLVGSVAVANLSFQKLVVCRFTFDYWKTTSEVVADYSMTMTEKLHPNGTDRFNFAIRLSDTADLENKTMYFCVRYNVDGREFWDNNMHLNFQVDFRKKYQKQAGKSVQQVTKSKPVQAFSSAQSGSTSGNGLPRSSRRTGTTASGNPSPPRSHHRSKSMPAGLGIDDINKKPTATTPQKDETTTATPTKINPLSLLDDEPIALRLKPKRNPSPENQNSATTGSSSLAFSNRYDFGASLSAARMEPSQKVKVKTRVVKKESTYAPSFMNSAPVTVPCVPVTRAGVPGVQGTAIGSRSSFENSSYEEIVNKYCFFGSKPAGPVLDHQTSQHASAPANQGRFSPPQPAPKNQHSPSSFGSSAPGHSTKPHFSQHAGGTQHHHLSYNVPVSAPVTPSGAVPLHKAALRCQQAMLGFPPKRPQPQPHQIAHVGFVHTDGSVTPSTPGSSNSSSPTITLASPSSPLSPPAMLPTGMPAIPGKTLKEYEFSTGSMHERLHASATAITS